MKKINTAAKNTALGSVMLGVGYSLRVLNDMIVHKGRVPAAGYILLVATLIVFVFCVLFFIRSFKKRKEAETAENAAALTEAAAYSFLAFVGLSVIAFLGINLYWLTHTDGTVSVNTVVSTEAVLMIFAGVLTASGVLFAVLATVFAKKKGAHAPNSKDNNDDNSEIKITAEED